MPHTVSISKQDSTITLNNFTVNNPDFFAVVSTETPEAQAQMVLDVIAVGSAAMQRVRTTIDVDHIEKRFGALSSSFERALGALEIRAADALSKRFSPTESGSYTKQIGDVIADAKRDVQNWQKELQRNAQALLDPNSKTSGIGKVEELIQQANSKFAQMFNPDLRTSYAFQLNQQLSQLFGTDGQAGALQAALQEALKPVFSELHQVKEKLEAKKAAEQIIEVSTLKGKPFEESVHAELAHLARPYGDDVEMVASGSNGSRAGDFLISFAGLSKRVVVEARNRKQISLPAIKTELDREMHERAADFAIYVSSGDEMLPQQVGGFQLYGNKVVTVIDNLPIAYRLTRVLAATVAPEGSIDIGALRNILAKIKDVAKSMRDIKSKVAQVKKCAEGINTDANDAEDLLLSLIGEAETIIDSSDLAQTA